MPIKQETLDDLTGAAQRAEGKIASVLVNGQDLAELIEDLADARARLASAEAERVSPIRSWSHELLAVVGRPCDGSTIDGFVQVTHGWLCNTVCETLGKFAQQVREVLPSTQSTAGPTR